MLSATAAHVVAIGVLAAAVAAVVGRLALLARSMGLPLSQATLFGLNQVMARVLWRATASGPLPVEPGQGAVIVCNHRGPFDPSFLYLTTSRLIHWMVAKEYCEHPLFGWFMRTAASIPVSRGGIDTAATKAAIRYARDGHLVGLFPEGRINTTDRVLLPGRRGAALIALRARVPVIPCYLTGSPNDGTPWGFLLMPAKVRLEVGRAIDTAAFCQRENEREAAEDLTRLFLGKIARLGGHEDFQPELAGRLYKPRLNDA